MAVSKSFLVKLVPNSRRGGRPRTKGHKLSYSNATMGLASSN
ncbi:hypothetical protein I314_06733 [Cryptococcus bacillisporus CA1873]|uniref:Uncharacterized protein n=2 Tax=Cryptococcus gattii TaxID=552467 RepID=A0A0D0TD87_CRYGA|nr:hypothetical protein I312_06536 [Cryptococcus bacillisporus CA1280]KIR57497.1 hypothetical protein I314_06733 [Cryptococcus bacillisporus CA1873]|eukprot:KIR57497.1 hypothetical protein I314_06733 [Cryptococcus gattii CA1873]